jgi:sugar phosphate isomerase/epimerase
MRAFRGIAYPNLSLLPVISTHVLLTHRLHPGLLDTLARTGAQGIELFAARQHFDYASRHHVVELAEWFRSSAVKPHSMHAPLYPDKDMGRSGAHPVNIVHPEKSRRIDAMDEVKRALEVAELIPYGTLVLHVGERGSGEGAEYSQRAVEHAVTAIEHLKAFAAPLGVRLALENILNDITTAGHLLEILATGHLSNVGVCLDTGHANIAGGVRPVIAALRPHIVTTHIHDNAGEKDEHLWPGEGHIDWPATMAVLASAPKKPAAVLEIHYDMGEAPETLVKRAAAAFRFIEESLETSQKEENA